MLLLRTSQVINLSAVESSINLYSKAGNPTDARNVLFFNNANKTANTGLAAVTIGSSWKGGSTIYLNNANGVSISGATGNMGANGAGGKGGAGGVNAGGATPGSSGSAAANGAQGSTALNINSSANVTVLIYNLGTISGGTGGPPGIGGGGGGGAAN